MLEPAAKTIAASCLLAFDVDRTILSQPNSGNRASERRDFETAIAPALIRAVSQGVQVALVTGNSLDQLRQRSLKWIVESLVQVGRPELIERFHFFSTGAGLYLHIPDINNKLTDKLAQDGSTAGATPTLGKWIDHEYLLQTRLDDDDVALVVEVLNQVVPTIDSGGKPLQTQQRGPGIDQSSDSVVQITIKPVQAAARSEVAKRIQNLLDEERPARFRVRPAGRTSIDVTLHFLDKSFALRWLINRLRIQGNEQLGQPFGANLCFMGDEVTEHGTAAASGNDMSVSRIDGALVLAVDPSRPVPLRTNIIVPSVEQSGPMVTAQLLDDFNAVLDKQLSECRRAMERGTPQPVNAVEAFKTQVHLDRIRGKLDQANHQLPSTVLQAIDALVTIASRDSPATRRLVQVINQHIDELVVATQQASGPLEGALGLSADE